MSQSLKGLCQHCQAVIEFSPSLLGTSSACPVCGEHTRLRIAPEELVATAGPGIPVSTPPASDAGVEEDAAETRFKRSLLKLGILTAVLLAILIGLVITAEWLARKKKNLENRKKTEQIMPVVPLSFTIAQYHRPEI
jgi:hypothetical protein